MLMINRKTVKKTEKDRVVETNISIGCNTPDYAAEYHPISSSLFAWREQASPDTSEKEEGGIKNCRGATVRQR